MAIKNRHYFSPGCPGEKKIDFLTREILATHQTDPPYPALSVSGKNDIHRTYMSAQGGGSSAVEVDTGSERHGFTSLCQPVSYIVLPSKTNLLSNLAFLSCFVQSLGFVAYGTEKVVATKSLVPEKLISISEFL